VRERALPTPPPPRAPTHHTTPHPAHANAHAALPRRPAQHYRKNQYEEALFRAEDDHFELDMVMEQNASTLRALRPLAAALEAMGEEERGGYAVPEGVLRAFHWRAIQRIYGEQGQQVGACEGKGGEQGQQVGACEGKGGEQGQQVGACAGERGGLGE
jgi:hypothetical protein